MGGAFGQGKSSTCKQTASDGMTVHVPVIVSPIYRLLINDSDRTRYVLHVIVIIFPASVALIIIIIIIIIT